MRIGSKVKIEKDVFLPELIGCVGTIVDEKIPSGQAAMISGITSWIIHLDNPIVFDGEEIYDCPIREDCLALV